MKKSITIPNDIENTFNIVWTTLFNGVAIFEKSQNIEIKIFL